MIKKVHIFITISKFKIGTHIKYYNINFDIIRLHTEIAYTYFYVCMKSTNILRYTEWIMQNSLKCSVSCFI